jgi:protein-arginine kinase activator protein McsA
MSDDLRCQNCGEPVSEHFARVFGDNNDSAHACYACASYNAITNGAASDAAATTHTSTSNRSHRDTSWARNSTHHS